MNENRSQEANTIIAQSMGANITGLGQSMRGARGFWMQAVWSGGGSPVGTLALQHAMSDVDADYKTFREFAIAADGFQMYDNTAFSGAWVRAIYTRSSGTGTMNVTLNRKE